MDPRDSHALIDAISNDFSGAVQQHVNAAPSHGDASSGNTVEAKLNFQCMDCSKSYSSRKSLQRHLGSTANACKHELITHGQVTAHPAKPRWACSRCGKQCATKPSVDRHIGNSCWRACDECVANGKIRCDSATANGPCRTCEGKDVPCIKYTSAVPGTRSVELTGAEAQHWQFTVGDEDTSISDQTPAKRKTISSPMTSPERAHKTKRPTFGQPVIDYGENRVVDPLGGQAHVPPQIKEAAVSNWLSEQSGKSALTVSNSSQTHRELSNSNQTGSMSTLRFGHYQPALSFKQMHPSCGNLPTLSSFPPSHQGNRLSTPIYQQHLPSLQRISNYGATVPPGFVNLSRQPTYDGMPSMTVGGPMQYNQMYLHKLRQQNGSHQVGMARQFAPHNRMGPSPTPPPFGASGPLHCGFNRSEGRPSIPSLQAQNLTHLGPSRPDLHLRIHSNTYDRNGQPIFSILRMHADEAFGPHLNAYCVCRGKEYGKDWIFVYRYQNGTQESLGHAVQITLTWDMTPADVKFDGFPDIVMRKTDTIYVMEADKAATDGGKHKMGGARAVQSAGPQVSHHIVDITNGETRYFQNPDTTRQWTEAIDQHNVELRALLQEMQLIIGKFREDIDVEHQKNIDLNNYLIKVTKMSKEYREMVQRAAPTLFKSAPGPQVAEPNLSEPPAVRVSHQHPAPLDQPVQQHIPRKVNRIAEYYERCYYEEMAQKRTNNDFIKKCEAVREPKDDVPQQLQPIRFPSFESGSTVLDPSLNMDFAPNTQVQNDGHFSDGADEVAAESAVEEMTEE